MVVFGGAPKCPRCNKSVYAAEEIIGPEGAWHRSCFKCNECKRGLDTSTMAEHQSEIYCRNCHNRLFRPGGGGNASQPPPPPPPATPPRSNLPATDLSPPSSIFSSGRRQLNLPPSRDICPRCQQTIYHAEKVVGPGGPWHRSCFKCNQCKITLNSTILAEHQGEAFCRNCYTKLFSPRGYNIGGSLEVSPQRQTQTPFLASSNQELADMREPGYLTNRYTESTLRIQNSAVAAAASAAVAGQQQQQQQQQHITVTSTTTVTSRPTSSSRLSFGRPYRPKSFGMPGVIPADVCPRCQKTIYAAELGMAAGRKYHKRCISCRACHTSISSLQITEHDGDIYCKQCYAKDFGPKGFRPSLGTSMNNDY